jgi:hypothetical protein
MFDLNPGVHLHEPDAIRPQPLRCIGDEFDCARTNIADGFRCLDRRRTDCLARGLIHAGCWSFLDHLLMAALQGAITLKQMDHVAVTVAKDLNFDMARAIDVFFKQHTIIAKRCFGFAAARGERVCKGSRLFYPAHAFSAAAGNRLDQDWIADFAGFLLQALN